MSWSASCTVNNGSNKEQVDAALAGMQVNGGTAAGREQDEQVAAAKGAALRLLDGAFGVSPWREGIDGYLINISGHANPKHAPTKGWSNDCVTITVMQKPSQEPEGK